MSRLTEALSTLGLDSKVTLAGRWVTFQGERCPVHVVEAPWGGSFFGWCDDPAERAIRHYLDPMVAIRDGLRRAAGGTRPEQSRKTERSEEWTQGEA
jgi:hypothetical protein